jgi:hypothetical protein
VVKSRTKRIRRGAAGAQGGADASGQMRWGACICGARVAFLVFGTRRLSLPLLDLWAPLSCGVPRISNATGSI